MWYSLIKSFDIKKDLLLFVFFMLLLSGCSIDYKAEYWNQTVIAGGLTSAGKSFSVVQRTKGIKLLDCSGHNPIIEICVRPREYYIDFISDGKSQGSLLRPDNIRVFYPINEDRMLALQYPGHGINVLDIKSDSSEAKVIGTISYEYLNSAAAEKQDITISRDGNFVGWAEPTGLSVMDLRNGQQRKYFSGLPVRLPVFSEDEQKVAFYVWFDTVAAKGLGSYEGLTRMNSYTIKQHEYNTDTKKYVDISTTIEYACLVAMDLNTEKLVKIQPTYPTYSLKELD